MSALLKLALDDIQDTDWIRAVNFEIQVPRIIRLMKYDRISRNGVNLIGAISSFATKTVASTAESDLVRTV